eukprot:1352967-Amorphochlora_amoeboformis.AAC.1
MRMYRKRKLKRLVGTGGCPRRETLPRRGVCVPHRGGLPLVLRPQGHVDATPPSCRTAWNGRLFQTITYITPYYPLPGLLN